MSKCLLTGTPGWLGGTLLRQLLSSNRSVHLIIDPIFSSAKDIRSLLPPTEGHDIGFTTCDLRDYSTIKKSLNDIGTVFHLAASQHPAKVKDFYQINSDATAELARSAAAAGAKRFIFVSSCSVQGSSDTPTSESTPLHGYTHYTRSKIKAEQLLQQVSKETGLDVIIVRPGVFYGASPSINMKRLMYMVQNNFLPVFGKDGFKRSYVQVEKVAEALLLAEKNGTSGCAYLIGDSEPLTTVQLYEVLAESLGCKPKMVHLPVFIARASELCTFEIGKTLGMHVKAGNVLGEFGRATFFSSTNAADLGYEPLPSSRPGLAEMARSYLASSSK